MDVETVDNTSTESYPSVNAVKDLLARNVSVEEQMVVERRSHPNELELLEEMSDLTEKKFYHELTDTYFKYLSKGGFPEPFAMLEFFQFIVAPFKTKLNPLRLGQLLLIVCERIDGRAALEFMSAHEKAVAVEKEALLIYKSSRSFHMSRCGMYKESEALLEEAQSELDRELGLDLSVSASFHKASATLYQALGKLDEYYRHAILYLSYTSLNSIPEDERVQLAYDISIAAIMAETTYNFGELLQLPLINELKSSDKAWVYELLVAYNEGKWELFDSAFKTHNELIMKSPLADKLSTVQQKITLLAMMEMAFRKPKKHRKLTFDEISEHCRIQKKEVELCLMKAMSNNLVRGQIDEIEQVVRLFWVKPRILDNTRLELMAQRIDSWSKSASELLVHLEELTPELLVS